jgi:lipopolysaccharide export system protein LptC
MTAPGQMPAELASLRQRVGLTMGGRGPVDGNVARRSRLVGLMKVALPIVAMALAGLVLAWPQFAKKAGFLINFADVEVSDGGLTMHKARFRGADRSGQPFFVTADSANQEIGGEKLVTLDQVAADMTRRDGNWLSLTADTGVFNQAAQRLVLQGNVNVFSDRGFEMHGDSADIDMKNGTIATDDKVWGQGPLGTLTAGNMRVYDKGARVVFEGRVKTVLTPAKGRIG